MVASLVRRTPVSCSIKKSDEEFLFSAFDVGGNDVSASLKKLDAWVEANKVGRFSIMLDNTGGTWNGTFGANDVVDINIDSADVLDGWVDNVHPIVDQEPDVFTQTQEIIGRCYMRELVDLLVDKYYGVEAGGGALWYALDIVDDLLSEASANITYTSPGSGTRMTYDSKDAYLFDSFRKILNERLNYDFYVDKDKALQTFAQGANASGITLTCTAAGGAANNILHFQWDANDGTGIKNYVLVNGIDVDGGWTEMNNADFTVPTDGSAESRGNVVRAISGAGGYVNCVSGDIGKTVVEDPGGARAPIGVLILYNNTDRIWWIEGTGTVASADNLEVASGTGECTTNSAGVDFPPAAGMSQIRFLKGAAATSWIALDIYNGGTGRYGRTSLDWSTLSSGTLSVAFKQDEVDSGFLYYYVRLYDSAANAVEWRKHATTYSINFMNDGRWTEFSFPVGPDVELPDSDNTENDWWFYQNGTAFNWDVRKIEFGAVTVGGDPIDEFYIDRMKLPAKMSALAQDGTSQSAYGVRMLKYTKLDIPSQYELDLWASDILEKRKDPIKLFRVWAKGSAGNTGGTNSWTPGSTLTLNVPGEGITSEVWRMVSIHHIYDGETVMNGHDYVCEVVLTPEDDILDMRRYEQLYEDVALIRDVREYVRWLENEQKAEIRYPAPPAPIGDLYLLSSHDWSWFMEAESSFITLDNDTSIATDATATDGLCVFRAKTEASDDMWSSSSRAVPQAAVGTHYIYLRMKVDDITSTDDFLTIRVYDTDASAVAASKVLKPSFFGANDTWEFISMAFDSIVGHSYRFEGVSFVTGKADVSFDWIGCSNFSIPLDTTGLSVDANSTGNTNANADADITVSSGDADITVQTGTEDITVNTGNEDITVNTGATGLANDAISNHTHSLTNTAGFIVTSTTTRYCASTSGGATTTAFTAITGTSSQFIATGVATITDGAHNHTHSSDTHAHTDTPNGHAHADTPNGHAHADTANGHPHGDTANGHGTGQNDPTHLHGSTEGGLGHTHR